MASPIKTLKDVVLTDIIGESVTYVGVSKLVFSFFVKEYTDYKLVKINGNDLYARDSYEPNFFLLNSITQPSISNVVNGSVDNFFVGETNTRSSFNYNKLQLSSNDIPNIYMRNKMKHSSSALLTGEYKHPYLQDYLQTTPQSCGYHECNFVGYALYVDIDTTSHLPKTYSSVNTTKLSSNITLSFQYADDTLNFGEMSTNNISNPPELYFCALDAVLSTSTATTIQKVRYPTGVGTPQYPMDWMKISKHIN